MITSPNQPQFNESPPLQVGPQRLHYQYSTVLPQIHLVLVSTLQGITFGLLLFILPLPSSHIALFSPAAFDFFNLHYWFLPYIIDSLLLLFIWNQFVYVSMFLIWPLSFRQSAVIFLLTTMEVLTVRVTDTPASWLLGLGGICLCSTLIHINNIRMHYHENFESPKLIQLHRRSPFINLGIYLIIATECFGLGIAYYDIQRIFLWTPWFIYSLVLCELIALVVVDRYFRQLVLREIVKDTQLEVTSYGSIRYRRPDTK